MRDRRVVDAIDAVLRATTDPIEFHTLTQLADRANHLARRSYGVRGLFR